MHSVVNGASENHKISGISHGYFSKTCWYFSCVFTSTINANCITNPWLFQLLGAAQAPGSGSSGRAPHPGSRAPRCSAVVPPWVSASRYRGSGNTTVSFVDEDSDRRQRVFRSTRWGSLFVLSNSFCSVFHSELTSWFSFYFPLPPPLLYPSKSTFNCSVLALNNGCHVFQVLKGHKQKNGLKYLS